MMAGHRLWRTRAGWPLPNRVRRVDRPGAACGGAPIRAVRQHIRLADLPARFGLAGPRLWLPPGRPPPRRGAAAVSLLLHGTIVAVLLLLVRTVVPAPPAEEPAVTMLFEPVAVPAAKPAVVPPPVAQPPPAPAPRPPPEAVKPPPTPPVEAAQPPPAVAPSPPPVPAPTPAPQASEVQAQPLPMPPPLPLHPPPRMRPPPQRPAVARQEPPPVPQAAPAPAPVPPPAASQSAAPRVTVGWQRAVSAWLTAHRVYPAEARRRDEQGNVTVEFTVEPSGRVAGVSVVHSSGYAILDQAATTMLRDATLPPFDPLMRRSPITTEVQIRYTLQD